MIRPRKTKRVQSAHNGAPLQVAPGFAIYDAAANTFYRQSSGPGGWYGPFDSQTRVYGSFEAAARVIMRGGHHVVFPGTRQLSVRTVTLSTDLAEPQQ